MKYILCFLFAISICCVFANTEVYATLKPTIDVSCVETKQYSKVGGKYYFLGDTKVTWFEAAHLCRRFGGDLALIESAEEMTRISEYLKGKGYDGNAWFWISGNDLVANHQFISLTSGLPLPFTLWSAGQPDFPGQEHCVHIWLRDGTFRMNNWVCTQKAFYICQIQESPRCHVVY
ncbi:C-type lectin 37Db-like [Drosophila sulfurigaster albostrigata]|uniref:C-type lectin 37Db-like n=1 Tax=Drosophila sulfurigaster albostrigata TaxID=89887 RepID=UPI002D21B4D6|nr:C-type lectin 37Db-like [Drosophila sulfurigaster albostrigata]